MKTLTPAAAAELLTRVSADTHRSRENLRQLREACWALKLAPEVRRLVETALLYRVGPWWPIFDRYRTFSTPKRHEETDVTLMPTTGNVGPDEVDIFAEDTDDLEDVFA